MSDPLVRLLQTRDWLLADGATGTALINAGFSAKLPAEACNLENPQLLEKHHDAVIAAGCDIFLTNSFGANRLRLTRWGAADSLREINQAAAEIANNAAARSGRDVQVAGCLGPTGEILAPIGSMTQAQATEIYHEQAEALRAGGVNLLWAETLSSVTEVRAVSEAAKLAGMNWVVTLSFDTAGKTMMGTTPLQMVNTADGLRYKPIALGANCGTGPLELLMALKDLVATGAEFPLVAKANAGVPHARAGLIGYDGSPELMADYAVLARDLGARIIGGCCGSSADHLRAMRDALETRTPEQAPDAADIASKLTR